MRRLYLALILLFAYSGHGYASCKRSGNEGAICGEVINLGRSSCI